MTINAVSPLASFLLPLDNTSASNTTQGSASVPQDSSANLSPAALFLNRLEQLQQQNPDQFKQTTSNLADRLRQAAQVAQKEGNSSRADSLNKLADQFQNASATGQMPSLQALQQAGLGGHHHHGHHGHGGQSAFQNSTTDANRQSLLASLLAPASGTSTAQSS